MYAAMSIQLAISNMNNAIDVQRCMQIQTGNKTTKEKSTARNQAT